MNTSRCAVCDKQSTLKCGHCGDRFTFCSYKCGSDMAEEHAAVCFNNKSVDSQYVTQHLEDAIIDMQLDVGGRHDEEEIADAIEIYSDLPHTMDEAKLIINEHLSDHEGTSLIGGNYQLDHLLFIANDRKDDELAAKRAQQAADLRRKAADQRAREQGIRDRAAKRAEAARQRGLKRQARQERRAAKQEERARKLQERAVKRRARGERQAAAADRRGGRIDKFGNWRGDWNKRGADRKDARAMKREEQARRALPQEDEEEE